jgi:CRISPR-associated protein Cas8a1/Csx13
MTQITLSIYEPNTLLPHRGGIAGLALALSALSPNDAPVRWEVTEDGVNLSWEGSDKEAVLWLTQQTYQIKDGYLNVPVLNLDTQGKYTFSEGVITTFLQHSKQRSLNKTPVSLSFTVEEGQPEITLSFRPLENCYYTQDFKEAFNNKGKFNPKISLKGQHLPGLVECFVNGAYQESPEGFLALLFLPLACSYYKLPGYGSALVIPEVTNLPEWVKQRKLYPSKSYQNFRSSGAGESGLRFLLQEKLVEHNQQFRVNYCEVYQLGKQPWDGNQSYLKQAVYRIQVTDEILGLYQNAYYLFPNQVRKNDKGETWLAISKVLPWIADNLVAHKVWYSGFYEFRKHYPLYERKGLITMTQYLTPDEQILFDAIQGAFSSYLRGQIQQATKQGRSLDYGQVTDKVIHRLQRPSTQQEFATALVDFLSQFRSKKARGVGAQIYSWIHREANWKQARDLALLAITTYSGKGKDGTTEIPEEIIEKIDANTEVETETFEMSL